MVSYLRTAIPSERKSASGEAMAVCSRRLASFERPAHPGHIVISYPRTARHGHQTWLDMALP